MKKILLLALFSLPLQAQPLKPFIELNYIGKLKEVAMDARAVIKAHPYYSAIFCAAVVYGIWTYTRPSKDVSVADFQAQNPSLSKPRLVSPQFQKGQWQSPSPDYKDFTGDFPKKNSPKVAEPLITIEETLWRTK